MTKVLLGITTLFSGIALSTRIPAPGIATRRPPWVRFLADRPRDEALAVALALSVAWFVYVAAVGGDYEPTARFYIPVLALVLLLFQEALRTFVLLFQNRRGRCASRRPRWPSRLRSIASVQRNRLHESVARAAGLKRAVITIA